MTKVSWKLILIRLGGQVLLSQHTTVFLPKRNDMDAGCNMLQQLQWQLGGGLIRLRRGQGTPPNCSRNPGCSIHSPCPLLDPLRAPSNSLKKSQEPRSHVVLCDSRRFVSILETCLFFACLFPRNIKFTVKTQQNIDVF